MLKLDSVVGKIDRAQEHGRLLDEQLIAWMNQGPYALSRKVNSDFRRHSVIVSIVMPPPLTLWGLILGDAIHNLRSALDHLVYAISVHELKADPPPNEGRSAFIINDTPNDFKSKYWHIEDLSLPVRKAIESVQPYNRKHATSPPLLAVLRDFDDADKHRLIKVALERPIDITFKNVVARPEDVRFDTNHGSVVDGYELGSITVNRPIPNLQFDCSASLSICVEHAPGPEGQERRGIEALVLEDLIPEVREVVGIVSAAVAT